MVDSRSPFCVDYRFLVASYQHDPRIASAFEETTLSKKVILNNIEHLYRTTDLDDFMDAVVEIEGMIRAEGLTDFNDLSGEDMTDMPYAIAFLEGLAIQMVMGKAGAELIDEYLGPLVDIDIGPPIDPPTEQTRPSNN